MKSKVIAAIVVMSTMASGLLSCDNKNNQNTGAKDVITNEIATDSITHEVVTTNVEDDYVLMYAVVADTSLDYYKLDKKMYSLSAAKNIPVDTMGRYYDAKKKKIILPDTDEDEMYRGEYFPRRFPSTYLSLEYYATYTTNNSGDMMAICAGLFENEKEADSVLKSIKSDAPQAFKVAAKMYLGCMH